MALLVVFAFIAGAGTALSPCVLPVLPIALSAGVGGGRRRPLGVVTGLALSFTFATVALVYLIDALGLPGGLVRTLAIVTLIAFGLALLIKTFLLQAFYIPSESMLPTLQVGDRVLVNKLVYRIHPPRRGDIIVFIEDPGPKKAFWGRVRSFFTEGLGVTKPKSLDFIKRVIGLPGETIQITNGVTNDE